MSLIFILIFFLGASLGSFYHVVGYRMPIGENWVSDRSRCPGCSHELRFYELMPVLSYVLQGGKCRSCGMKIKPIYLLSEIFAGLLFIFPVWFYGFEGFEPRCDLYGMGFFIDAYYHYGIGPLLSVDFRQGTTIFRCGAFAPLYYLFTV